jgi:hypothetical protein
VRRGILPHYEVALGPGGSAVFPAETGASCTRRFDVRKIWVQLWAVSALLQTVTAVAITIVVLLGIAAMAGGALIALFASRRAPDGFEDQDGFHVGRLPPAALDK